LNRPTVVIPADFPALASLSPQLDRLREFADVRLHPDRPQSEAEIVDRLQEADILLNSRGSLKIPGRVIEQLPRLQMIAVCGIGYDAIDLPATRARGIVVCNVPGRTKTVVAEHAFGLMLAVARRMAATTAQLQAGRWTGELGISLIGKQLGVIGTGNIGCEMIRLSRAFGMQAVAWSLHPDPAKAAAFGFRCVEFDELLQSSDVVSLHTRLSDDTRGLIGARELSLMRHSAILINTSRGAVVDTVALVAALKAGRLFGAGLDVFEQEPLRPGHLLVDCPNVVLTPHTADQTQEGIDLITGGCVDNIQAFLSGQPVNVV
jgi:phosphoglycerate dehydrogenase-like enzyme